MYRDRLAELAERYPNASGPELARRLAAELDAREQRALAEDYLSTLSVAGVLAQQVRYMNSRDRQALLKSVDILRHEPPVTDEDKLSVFDRVPAWREYAPGVGNRVVLDMTRGQLEAAINHRMKSVTTSVWVIEVMRRIHAGMDGLGPDRPASDVFSDDQIASLFMKTRQEMKSGRLRFRYDFDAVPSLPGPIADARQNRRRRASVTPDD